MKTSLLPYKPAELAHNRALGGIVTKYKTRDRYDDDQQRGNREDRIVSNRGGAAEVLVIDKSGNRIFNQNPRLADHKPPRTTPYLLLRPAHDRNRADAVLRAAFDDPVAVGYIDQHIALLVEEAHDLQRLE
jgi:hypothetical protein